MRGAAKEKRAGSRLARAAVLLLAVLAVGLLASPASASLPRPPAVGGITGDPLAAVPAAAWPPLHTEPAKPSLAPSTPHLRLRLFGSGSHGFGLFGRQRPGYDAGFLLETRLWAFELDSGAPIGLERLQVLEGNRDLRLFATDRRRGPRNRYYDPELGRFITADPMGYVDGPSMYQFAGYSPVNLGDPLGLQNEEKREWRWWNPFTWFGAETEVAVPSKKVELPRVYSPIYVQVEPIKSSTAWSEAEIEVQLHEANRIFGEQASVYVFWTRIKEDPDPKEALTAEGAEALLRVAAREFAAGTGGYEGLPIFYVRETSDNSSEGGRGRSPDYPTDRRRAAIVNRFWRGKLTNQYVTAHELGHALGGLCDPTFTTDPSCGFGAPRPEYGGVMNYPSPYYEGVQGEGLSEGEIKRLRKNAQALGTRPGGAPP